MPALATDALLPAQKKKPAIGAGLLSLVEKIRRGQLPHTSPAIGYNARSKWELCQSRPELFGMDSGESGRRTGGIFR